MAVNEYRRQFTREDIAERFDYHPPGALARELHERVRARIGDLAHELNLTIPDGREKAQVMTDLESAMFHANAAIARNAALHEDVEQLVEQGMAKEAEATDGS